MCAFEEKWLLNAKVSPLFWNRYVDDTFTMFHNKDSANDFLHYLNGCHRNIKFTIEFEQNNAIPFLDILATRNQKKDSSPHSSRRLRRLAIAAPPPLPIK